MEETNIHRTMKSACRAFLDANRQNYSQMSVIRTPEIRTRRSTEHHLKPRPVN